MVADVAAAGAAVPVVVAAAPLLEVPDPEPVAEEPALAAAAPGGGGHPAGGLLPGGGFLPGAGGGGQFTAPVVAVGSTTAVGTAVGGGAVGVAGTTTAVGVAGTTTAVGCAVGDGCTTATCVGAAGGTEAAAAQPASNNGQHNPKLNKFLFIVLPCNIERGLPTLSPDTSAIYLLGKPAVNCSTNSKFRFVVLFANQELPILFRVAAV